ncbi:MAG TPA: DUF4058 family protein [Planctomycetaceae bacterium]
MPSPFPGMNPYLEQPDAWHDFHERFCPAVAEALSAQIRPKYIAKIDEHVYLHELSAEDRRFAGRGDVTIARESTQETRPSAGLTASAASAIGSVLLAVDEERLSYVRVLDRRTREVVAVIELLSPSNKDSGADRSQYLGKRERILESPAHLVEIDLLRGSRLPIKGLPDCDYYVMVSRAEMRPKVELWAFRLRDPLPKIPIPLRVPDPDAVLDLRAILDRVYAAAGYEDYIYAGSPVPPLPPEDERWVAELLAAARRGETAPPRS